jgi:hypothetical protein
MLLNAKKWHFLIFYFQVHKNHCRYTPPCLVGRGRGWVKKTIKNQRLMFRFWDQKHLTHPALRAPLPTSREGRENPISSADAFKCEKMALFNFLFSGSQKPLQIHPSLPRREGPGVGQKD